MSSDRLGARRCGYRGGIGARMLAVVLAAGGMAHGAGAVTLRDAIRLAYQTNPELRGQRAEQRAVGEGYVQARAQLGPQANINGEGGPSIARVDSGASLLGSASRTTYRGTTGTAIITVTQPVFTFGAASAAIRGARSTVLSGREALRQTEAEVLGKVITAYVDVRQDRGTIAVLEDEIANLTKEFVETRERGAAGEMDKTDVAEAQARLLQAQSELELIRGRLIGSEARFLAVVGIPPDDLAPEPDLGGLPNTIAEAFDAADGNNPQIRSAIHDETAAREKVNEAKAAYGPTLSVRLNAGIQPTASYVPDLYNRSVSVTGVLSLPVFTAGMRSSKVREAGYRDDAAALKIEAMRREVIQNVAQAWGQMVAANAAGRRAQDEVEVYRIAVEGNQVEQRVGRRSIFELLTTEASYAAARIALLQQLHDQYLARASLLAAIGRLEAGMIAPGAESYDPTRSLNEAAARARLPYESVVEAIDSSLSPRTAAPAMSPAPKAHYVSPTIPAKPATP